MRLHTALLVLALCATVPAVATPPAPFFSARGAKARCAALAGWHADLVDLGGQGLEQLRMGAELLAKIAPAFQDDFFVRHFGKSFFSLSDREREQAQRGLIDCFPNSGFARFVLTTPFSYKEAHKKGRTYQDWMQQIEATRNAPPKEEMPAGLPSEPGERQPHSLFKVGPKLLATAGYRAYAGAGCELFVILRDRTIRFDAGIEQLALAELLPVLADYPHCPDTDYRFGAIYFHDEASVYEIHASSTSQRGREGIDVRRHEPSPDLEIEREIPVLALTYSGPAGGPYHFNRTYFDQLAFDFEPLYHGDPSLDSLDRVRAYVEDPAAKSPHVAELSRRREESRRKGAEAAEARRKAERAAERVEQRRQAQPLIALLARPPAAALAYDFSRFGNATLLREVYSGNFEPFVGDHTPTSAFGNVFQSAASLGAMVGNRNWRAEQEKIKANAARLADFFRRRTPLRLAVKAYHEAFADVCSGFDGAGRWTRITFRWDTVKRDAHGAEIERWKGEPTTRAVREPFADDYSAAYKFAADPGFMAWQSVEGGTSSFTLALHNDFTRLLRATGCGSPVARQLEVNLHLAHRWLPPAQELVP